MIMLIASALLAQAQNNVILNPSETFEYEHYQDYSGFSTPVYEKSISTGDYPYLGMSFYNKTGTDMSLSIVIKDALDGTVLLHDHITVNAMHISDRIECWAPTSSVGYYWQTEITVTNPPFGFDFEAYWIYRYRF